MKKIIAVVSLALAAGSAFAVDKVDVTTELTVLKKQGTLCKAEIANTGKKSGDVCTKFVAYTHILTQGNPPDYWNCKIASGEINMSNVDLFTEVVDLLILAYE